MIKKQSMFQTNFSNKEELFKQVSQSLESAGYVTAGFEEALVQREREYPTGLPTKPAVAIPHTSGTFVKADTIVCVVNNIELEFNEMGGGKEDVVFPRVIFVLVLANGETHLSELQKLINKIQEGDLIKKIITARSEQELEAMVNQYL